MRELEAMRGLVADLNGLVESTNVGSVPATDVANAFAHHTSRLPPDSKVLAQFRDLASLLAAGVTSSSSYNPSSQTTRSSSLQDRRRSGDRGLTAICWNDHDEPKLGGFASAASGPSGTRERASSLLHLFADGATLDVIV